MKRDASRAYRRGHLTVRSDPPHRRAGRVLVGAGSYAAAAAWRVLASATGDYSVEDAAKLLSRDPRVTIGKIRLFQFLNTEGLIYRHKGDGCWHVYQSAIDTGRLAERAQSHWNPKTEEWQVDAPQVRVTVKGLQHLHQRLTATAVAQPQAFGLSRGLGASAPSATGPGGDVPSRR
ncbi:phage antirepressor KilAC domain-containing protein [Glycomyces tritici]|uniref:phage antirepressor KilAC domain-containing protein n=1 Tax=Glycomyces tritici TaxID=2665176 RepID=UPI003EBF30C8